MRHRRLLNNGAIAGLLTALCAIAIAASEDKYSLRVPNGLAFSEFKGYETWELIAVSHNGDMLAAILGNPAMIDAYKAGIPANGQPFPDGAKMAKVHWNAKNTAFQVPSMMLISW